MLEEITTALVTSGVVTGLIVFVAQKSIEARIQQEVEKYKHGLERELDVHRHELQKLVISTQHKVTKTYEVIPALWDKLKEAQGRIGKLKNPRQREDWATYSPQEVETRINELGFRIPAAHLASAIHTFTNDPNKANKNECIWNLLDQYEYAEAQKAIFDAHNYRTLVEVFVTDEVNSLAKRDMTRATAASAPGGGVRPLAVPGYRQLQLATWANVVTM
jgi:hypothetical protein